MLAFIDAAGDGRRINQTFEAQLFLPEVLLEPDLLSLRRAELIKDTAIGPAQADGKKKYNSQCKNDESITEYGH
jgi:hypothetical protein